ncbi:MAG: phosphatase PAP2 family protein [Parcubacteria group bacterium]|nr:phosphatase PAP2 family protein [Parcubacteria group bacterium]
MANWDSFIVHLFNGWSEKSALVGWLAAFFSEYFPYLLVLGAVFLIFKERGFKARWRFFSLAALSVLLSRGILTETIRFFYYRPRPFLADSSVVALIDHSPTSSFPSGHAAFYFALALAVFSIDRKRGRYFLGGAAIVGLARVFAGAHWPSDIVVGAAVAAVSFFAAKRLLSSFGGNEKNEPIDANNA